LNGAVIIPELIAGCVLCLFGWTLYWIGLHAAGSALGGLIGSFAGLGVAILVDEGGQWGLAMIAGGAIIGAALGFFLIKRVHFLAFFLIGAGAGAVVAALTWPSLAGMREWLSATAGPRIAYWAVCAAGAGVLLAVTRRYVIVISAALVGTVLIVRGVGQQHAGLAFIPVFVSSLIAQFVMFRRFVGKGAGRGAAGAPGGRGGGGG